jgi:hypothetical protein
MQQQRAADSDCMIVRRTATAVLDMDVLRETGVSSTVVQQGWLQLEIGLASPVPVPLRLHCALTPASGDILLDWEIAWCREDGTVQAIATTVSTTPRAAVGVDTAARSRGGDRGKQVGLGGSAIRPWTNPVFICRHDKVSVAADLAAVAAVLRGVLRVRVTMGILPDFLRALHARNSGRANVSHSTLHAPTLTRWQDCGS